MSFWGSSLYSNDYTCDVRDTYIHYLETNCDNNTAFLKTIESYNEYLDTELEPLLWYALADSQWSVGRLMPIVKKNALSWLETGGGLELWKGNAKNESGWKKTILKLTDKLNKPQPKEKKIENPADFQYNPGDAGDVFSYQFHSLEAENLGYYNKYILLQKIGVAQNGYGYTCPHIVFFDKIFNEIPETINLSDLRVLPFDVPWRFMPSGKNLEFPLLNISAILDLSKKRNNPSKYVNYIGNFPIYGDNLLTVDSRAEFGWDSIEDTLLYYLSEWKSFSYRLYNNFSVVLYGGEQ